MASLTPPIRQASIWQTSIAPRLEQLLEDHAVLNVLARSNADRGHLAADARVAEHVVGTRRLLDPPRIVHAEQSIAEIASSTPHTWFASIISVPSRPSARRISRARRSSETRSAPTFILTCVKPAASASRTSDSTLSSP